MPVNNKSEEVIEVTEWRTPATTYLTTQGRRVRIGRSRYTRGFYEAYQTGPGVDEHYQYYHLPKGIHVTTLQIKEGRRWKTWMVDDPPHWWAMQEHARHYQGHVLCAGLGLGLIVHALQENPQVTKITVVEREHAVATLVSPHLPSNKPLTIVLGDWYSFQSKTTFDGVFFDLFVGNGHALIPQAYRTMLEMAQRFPAARELRIHGFHNRHLQAFLAATKSAQATLAELSI